MTAEVMRMQPGNGPGPVDDSTVHVKNRADGATIQKTVNVMILVLQLYHLMGSLTTLLSSTERQQTSALRADYQQWVNRSVKAFNAEGRNTMAVALFSAIVRGASVAAPQAYQPLATVAADLSNNLAPVATVYPKRDQARAAAEEGLLTNELSARANALSDLRSQMMAVIEQLLEAVKRLHETASR